MIQVVASLTINPNEPEALQKYFEVTMPLIKKVGAKVAQKIELGEAVIGDNPAKILMLVDYPTYDAVDAVFKSPEYLSIIDQRDKAFLNYNVCIVSKNELVADE